MNGAFTFHNAALPHLAGAEVTLNHVDSLNDGAVFLWKHFQNDTAFASIFAAEHQHHIIFLDMQLFPCHNSPPKLLRGPVRRFG